MSRRFMFVVLGISGLLFVAKPNELSAQQPCFDCFLLYAGGGQIIWECLPVSGPGYRNCTVGGVNCVMSGPCSPEFAAALEVEADGVLRDHTVYSGPALVPLPIGGVISECALARKPRTYSVAEAAVVKRTTSRIVI